MGFFSDADGDDLRIDNKDWSIISGAFKLVSGSFKASVAQRQLAQQQAALQAAAQQLQNQGQPQRTHSPADLPTIAMARPNLVPLKPKKKA